MTNNVASATTTNSGKSVNSNNNNSINANGVNVASVEVTREDVEVRSQKTWEQLMHTENVAAYMGIDNEVKNRITHECGRWSCEEMKKMAKKRNVKSYRILKPNGEETNSFVRANGTNLAVIEYVDGRESIYIKLYNEDADDLWWYLVEEKDLIGFYIVENKTDEISNEIEADKTYVHSTSTMPREEVIENDIIKHVEMLKNDIVSVKWLVDGEKKCDYLTAEVGYDDDGKLVLRAHDNLVERTGMANMVFPMANMEFRIDTKEKIKAAASLLKRAIQARR